MSKTFDSKVETLVEAIPPKFRGKVRRDINKLRRMGVHSIGSLLRRRPGAYPASRPGSAAGTPNS